jgi:GDP-L-fucose synthase
LKILVAGGTGLIGSAINEEFSRLGYEVHSISRQQVDLSNSNATLEYIQDLKPEMIVDSAARVGGIGANNSRPVDFLLDNLSIQNNLMASAHKASVDKFIFLGSSCIYPRSCLQPIKEEYLLTGKLEETNSAYAIAKIAGIELIRSYRKQYGKSWISLMPTNLYGPRDTLLFMALTFYPH